MTATVVFHEAIYNIGLNVIELSSHTFKAVLSDTAPSQANDDELADIVALASVNGYSPATMAGVTWAETGAGTGIWQWTVNDFSWTAVGGSFGSFRYIVWYDDTSLNDKLICYFDIGVEVTVSVGNQFLVDVGANGVFRIGQGTIS